MIINYYNEYRNDVSTRVIYSTMFRLAYIKAELE